MVSLTSPVHGQTTRAQPRGQARGQPRDNLGDEQGGCQGGQDQVVDYGLFLICPLLLHVGLDLPNFQLPLPVAAIQHDHDIAQQLGYHPAREQGVAEACRVQMNAEQLAVYEHILQCSHDGAVVFSS